MRLAQIIAEDRGQIEEIKVAAESLEDDGWTVHVGRIGGMISSFHAWKSGVALIAFPNLDDDGHVVTQSGLARHDSVLEAISAVHQMTTTTGLPDDPRERRKMIAVDPMRVIGMAGATSDDRVDAAVADPRIIDQLNLSQAERIAVFRRSPDLKRLATPRDREAMNLETVGRDPLAIRHIKDPSEAVKLAAVQQDGWAIRFIESPSEAVQLAAVTQAGMAIQYIRDPSEAVQLAALGDGISAYNIRFIRDPTEAVQLAAVRRFPDVIKHIRNPTAEVLRVAGRTV